MKYLNRHTPYPEGYVEWHNWVEKKAMTHEQIRCPGCGHQRGGGRNRDGS
jgi:hypothetical protein